MVALLAVALLAGCGDDASDDAGVQPAGSPAPTDRGAGAKLDEDALLAVNDNFVTCLQRRDELGVQVHYSNGQAASAGEGSGGAVFDDDLSAPKAIGELIDAGQAQYVGIRDNKRDDENRTPQLDILILASETDAETASAKLRQEAGRQPTTDGLFVAVPLDKRSVESPETDAVRVCMDESAP